MSAVAVAVHGVVVVVGEVPAVDIVTIAIPVIIGAVGRLGGVAPDVGGKVGMPVVNAGIHHGDDHLGVAGGEAPGLRGRDVRAGQAGVVEAPKPGEIGVVGRGVLGSDDIIRFGISDEGFVPGEGGQ